jgi:multiple sugar transport system ATP-binding protein
MRTELAEMRDSIDKNMVYVTHDQVEAMTLGDRIVVMADGLIQQQGTPEELFKTPVNKFVAGFIGSPTMNFLDGELVTEKGVTWVRGAGFVLPLPGELSTRLQKATNKHVSMGIRPSSFSADVGAGAPIELRVVVSEYLGAQSVLVTMCGDQEVLVETVSNSRLPSGTIQNFGVSTEEIMIFDATSGLRL